MKLPTTRLHPTNLIRFTFGFFALALAATLLASSLSQPSDAASLSGWKSGRIMDDVVMINSSTMNVPQIQNFLNSKVSSCDTNGAQPSEMNNSGVPDYNSDGTIQRWEWGKYKYNQTTFPCLKDYKQNNVSAAQLIYNAAQKYTINPQVLIVLLQKEQGLVTDTWPLSVQYKSATGYGCPDGSACDSQYYGLTNQLSWAAKMFRAIEDGSPSWYTPYILGNNYIKYNPISSCGGTTVNIQNRATQALYNYTPYQPNAAALKSGYGNGDACSSYGNRNFYLYFSDWFGSTYTSVRYAWRPVSQLAYTDSARTMPLTDDTIVAPGQTLYLEVTGQNMGYQTWDNTVFLGTSHPNDRTSVFANSSWQGTGRIPFVEPSVSPGEIGTFDFSVTAPQQAGTYREYFNMVAEGVTWMRDPGMYYTIDVIPRATASGPEAQLNSGQQLDAGHYLLSSDKHSVLSLQGDANLVLYSDFRARWSSGTQGGKNVSRMVMQGDGNLVIYNTSNQPMWDTGTGGHPNAFVRLQTDGNLVVYSSGGAPLWNSQSSSRPDYLGRVVSQLPTTSIYPGQSLETTDRKRKLVLQGDGNLVLYSSGTAVWASGTNGKNVAELAMQPDGNLVLYSPSRAPIWNTKTGRKGSAFLALQGDGNLVLYSYTGKVLWATMTVGK